MRWVWAKLYKKVKCIFSEFSLATSHGEGGLIEMGLLLQVHTDIRGARASGPRDKQGQGTWEGSEGLPAQITPRVVVFFVPLHPWIFPTSTQNPRRWPEGAVIRAGARTQMASELRASWALKSTGAVQGAAGGGWVGRGWGFAQTTGVAHPPQGQGPPTPCLGWPGQPQRKTKPTRDWPFLEKTKAHWTQQLKPVKFPEKRRGLNQSSLSRE